VCHQERVSGARAIRHLWRPLGAAQTRLVWRLIGWAMLLAVLRARGGQPLAIDPSVVPWAYHALALAAGSLALFGPRLVLLVAAAGSWIWVLFYIVGGSDPKYTFIADEFLLFAALPVLGALSAGFTLVEQRDAPAAERDDAVDRGQLWQLRMCTLAALVFAGLHKLNVDFMAPQTSCATLLGRRLAEQWSLPAIPLSPLGVVLAEGLAPVLLIFYPRLGALGLVVLAAGLGHVGPYAFNALLVALALAFLPNAAGEAWARRARRWWPALLVALPAVGLASLRLYQGPDDWWPYLLFEATLVLGAWLVLIHPGADDRASRWRPALPARPWLPGRFAHRSLCAYAALFMTLHGLSPYLGLKFRLSFAMLSNLRADDDRWNSLVVPRAVHLGATDPFVHVLGAYDPAGAPVKARAKDRDALRPGTYGPQEFRRRYEEAVRRGQPMRLQVRYLGVERGFGDLRFDPELRAFAAGLPRMPLFQSVLSGSRPQACVH